jgi:hypothetical protein
VARRAGLVLLLVVVVMATAGGWAGSASAYSGGPNSPMTDPANKALVKSLLRNFGTNPSTAPWNNSATSAASTAAQVESGLTASRGAAGVMPKLAKIPALLAIASAGYVGWQIGSPLGGFVYKKITGDTYGGSTTGLTITDIKWISCGTAIGSTSACSATIGSNSNFFGGGTAPNGYYFRYTTVKYIHCDPTGITTCGVASPGSAAGTVSSSLQATAGQYERQDTNMGNGTCGSTNPFANCVIFWRTPRQMAAAMKVEQSNATGYNSAVVKQDDSAFAQPSSTSDAELEAGLDAIGGYDSTTGSANEEAAADAINYAVDPGWSPGDTEPDPTFAPFALPQPLSTETYAQYVTRLRERGWLGTLTVEPASALESGADPASEYAAAPLHAPAGVLVSGPDPIVWVFDVGAPTPGDRPDPTWPDNPPQVPTASTGITIKEKPGSSVFPPGGGGGGDCDCDVAALDFGPLADIDPGDSFPFGVFGFVGDVFGPFNVSGDAPVFDFTLDCPGLADCDTYEFGPVDLDVMDGYMTIVRGLLAVILWIGAVWLVAVKLLGFKAGGDLTDGVDDGSVA